jgi:putative transposase
VRQWVLTMPYRLRYQLAWNHGLSRAVLRVYTRVLLDVYRRGARARGIEGGQTGMVTTLQRAGGALNANLHFHTLVLDGVFTEDAEEGAVAFHPAPGPSDAAVAAAGAPRSGAGRRRDGAGGSTHRGVLGAGGDRRGLAAGASGAGPTRGGAGAAARRRARHGGRDLARAAAGASGGVRSARQRVGVGERSGGGGAAVPLHLAPALRAGAPAAAERRAHRAGAEDALATARGSWCSSRWSCWSGSLR